MAIVDDHPVVRDGMAALLREYPGIEIAGTAASLDLAEPLLDPALVDVLLLDIRLGQETGFQLLERHRDAARRPAVVVLTAFAQAEYAAAAHRLGAAALVLKTAPMPELVAAIRAAALGEPVDAAPGPRATDPTLTTREQEIVRLVVDGRSNDEIGAALAIATKTVEGHLRRVFERLGIESRAELSARAVAEGWLDVPTVARRRGPGPTRGRRRRATPLIGDIRGTSGFTATRMVVRPQEFASSVLKLSKSARWRSTDRPERGFAPLPSAHDAPAGTCILATGETRRAIGARGREPVPSGTIALG